MGSVSFSEKLNQNKNRVLIMKELVHGHDCAKQLQSLLNKPFNQHGSVSIQELALRILRSFDDTLSVLSLSESGVMVASDPNQQASSYNDCPSLDTNRSEGDSGESKKRRAGSQDKRGCYKRKKNFHTRVIVSDKQEDGYGWRKYGQKDILNSKYPRSYFRCTHKPDQGCRATKQVQKVQGDDDEQEMFQTTYIGDHTCSFSFALNAPQMIKISETRESNNIINQQNLIFTTTPVVKEESRGDELTNYNNNLSPLLADDIMWSELMPFQSHEPDYYSCGESTSRNLEMDYVVNSNDFQCDFSFDGDEFSF